VNRRFCEAKRAVRGAVRRWIAGMVEAGQTKARFQRPQQREVIVEVIAHPAVRRIIGLNQHHDAIGRDRAEAGS